MSNTGKCRIAVAALAALGLVLATGAMVPAAAAEPGQRLVALLDTDGLGIPVTRGQLREESGGFNAVLPPAGLPVESETSAIILWDDCCHSGRGPRGRAHADGTVKASSGLAR